MSFLFNFESPDEDSGLHAENQKTEAPSTVNTAPYIQPLQATQITDFYDDIIISKLDMKTMLFGSICLKVVDTSTMEQKLLDDGDISAILKSSRQLSEAVSSHSDLVAGVYEGGLKIWECAIDLVDFLSSHPLGTCVDLRGKSVLEGELAWLHQPGEFVPIILIPWVQVPDRDKQIRVLSLVSRDTNCLTCDVKSKCLRNMQYSALGCGSGLPGLYCCKSGSKQVDFQEYNEEVLKLLTHTNVHNNLMMSEGLFPLCRYFTGDWSSFSRLVAQKNLKYDVILTAETIYNTDNYSKLHDIFKAALADDGIVFLAAKSYYFGVGGSVNAFIEYVRSENCFTVDTVHIINKGVQRQILRLCRQPAEVTKAVS